MNYAITWEIELDADSALDAARMALAIQRDTQSIATVFDLYDETGKRHHIDLSDGDSIADARRATLQSAVTLEQLDALYVQWIGYSMVADAPAVPACTADAIRSRLTEWIDAEREESDA